MVKLIFDIQDAQKGNEAISDNHFLSEKMKPEFSNTWLIDPEQFNTDSAYEFLEELIDHLTRWGIERDAYEFEPVKAEN